MRHFFRGATIIWIALRYGLDELVLTSLQKPWLLRVARVLTIGRKLDAPRGQRLREALEQLGPIFVKFGQVLSTRRDLLPPDIANELMYLQDRVPPFDPAVAVATIERAFQKPVDQVFVHFEREPVASASIAQVHFATIRDREGGLREVAVILGVLGVFGLVAISAKLYGPNIAAQARAAGSFILVSITVATIITYCFTPDDGGRDVTHGAAKWDQLRPFLLSRDFILLSLAVLVYNSAWTSLGAMGFFVAQYLYGVPDSFALSLAVSFAFAPLGMPVWMKLARRLGDKAALRLACLYLTAVVAALPLATRLGLPGLLTFQIMIGLGFGAGPYLVRSITGILANAYVSHSGSEVRGAAFAMTNFFDKLGSGLGASALLPLALLGFEPHGTVDAGARQALLIVATVAPLAGFALTAVLVHLLRTEASPTSR